MLARVSLLTMAPCLSACLSQVGVLFIISRVLQSLKIPAIRLRHQPVGCTFGPPATTTWWSFSIEVDSGSSWFWQRFLSTTPTVCFQEIQVCTKIKVLPSGTFS